MVGRSKVHDARARQLGSGEVGPAEASPVSAGQSLMLDLTSLSKMYKHTHVGIGAIASRKLAFVLMMS